MAVAPRKKPNGETAMRDIRRGTNSSCRPKLDFSKILTGLGRFLDGFHPAQLSRGTFSRKFFPAACRICQVSLFLRKSGLANRSSAASPTAGIFFSSFFARRIAGV
jgi:hypothetical protein